MPAPLLRLSAASVALLAVGCAPTAPSGGDGKSSVEVGLLEGMVYGHFDTFAAVESLAIDNGIDLGSEQEADWPRSGDATVNFGSSAVSTVFTVDRTDYSRVSRFWSVSLTMLPLMAAGEETTGDMTGSWEYWEEDNGDPGSAGTGWVVMELSGTVVSSQEPLGALTTVYAVVNEAGFVYEGEVVHGAGVWELVP